MLCVLTALQISCVYVLWTKTHSWTCLVCFTFSVYKVEELKAALLITSISQISRSLLVFRQYGMEQLTSDEFTRMKLKIYKLR